MKILKTCQTKFPLRDRKFFKLDSRLTWTDLNKNLQISPFFCMYEDFKTEVSLSNSFLEIERGTITILQHWVGATLSDRQKQLPITKSYKIPRRKPFTGYPTKCKSCFQTISTYRYNRNGSVWYVFTWTENLSFKK